MSKQECNNPAPVLWFKSFTGSSAKPNGQCYDVAFCEVPGYEPLYRHAAPLPPSVGGECDHDWTDDGEFTMACTECGVMVDCSPEKVIARDQQIAALSAQLAASQARESALRDAVSEVFHIGSAARSDSTILTNLVNLKAERDQLREQLADSQARVEFLEESLREVAFTTLATKKELHQFAAKALAQQVTKHD